MISVALSAQELIQKYPFNSMRNEFYKQVEMWELKCNFFPFYIWQSIHAMFKLMQKVHKFKAYTKFATTFVTQQYHPYLW